MVLLIKWHLQLLSVYALVCSVRMQACSSPPEIICATTIEGIQCNFKDNEPSIEFSPDRISIDGDLMFVGTTDHLISFNISNSLQFSYVTDHCPEKEALGTCLMQNDEDQCYNFVRFLQPIPAIPSNDTKYAEKILVCGTNAISPKCTVHSRGNLSDSFYLTNEQDDGFSPFLSDRPMIGLLGTNAVFYAATVFSPYGSQRVIATAPTPLEGSSEFSTSTLSGNQYWLSSPDVDFISMYEIGEYIYVFARETAQFPEIEEGMSTVYSRVMRVCKSDQVGFPGPNINQFLTFQKARMRCSSVRNTPNYPYDYNEIQSTYVVNGPSGDPVLYATFSSSPNGPKGSAVCKFEFNPNVGTSLRGIFESVEYFAPVNGDPTSPNWDKLEGAPFVCPGQSDGDQRNQQEVIDYKILMSGEAVATGDHDIYTADGAVFTQIAVETLTYGNSEYQIMFVGTDNGEVWQVVLIDDIQTFEFKRATLSSGNDITYMQVTVPNNATEIRKLYFANADFLSEITLGDCGKYTNCWECMEFNDPYCAWQDDSTCVNILLQPPTNQTTEAIKGFSRVVDICDPLPTTQSTLTQTMPPGTAEPGTNVRPSSVVPVDMSASSIDSATETSRPIVSGDPTPEGVAPDSQSVSTVVIAGAVVGGLVVGIIIGVAVGCVGLVAKRLMFDTKPSPAAIENGTIHYNSSQNCTTVTSSEPIKSNGVSSPTSSGSSQGLDIAIEELDDEVIADLPPSMTAHTAMQRKKKNDIPKGRTPSTRWLRASESEGNSL